MIKAIRKPVEVGKIIEYNDTKDTWLINREGVVEEYTTQYIEYARHLFVDDGMNNLYEEKRMKICSECRAEAFYDKEKEEYYCPMCEE